MSRCFSSGKRRIDAPLQPAASPGDPISLVTVISGLAHEIRNPLSNLKLNLQLLREDLSDLLGEERGNPPQRRILSRFETAIGEAARLERTLEQFLLFASNPRLELRRVEINSLVDELLEFFRPQAATHRVTMQAMLADQPLHVRLDPVMFKQALLNLLINAQQAMVPGGELVVRTEAVSGRPYLQVHVVDTGPGIALAQIDKIFQAYYSTKKGGTGLGLPISRKIVHALGGTLTVRSEPGKGSDFCVELPLCQE